jgi:hypothetical protein
MMSATAMARDATAHTHARIEYMATRTAIGTGAITAYSRAWNIFINDHSFTKHTTTGRTTPIMRTTRRATFRHDRILNHSPVKINHIDLVNHVAIDTPNIGEGTCNDRIRVIEFDSVFQDLNIGRFA